MRKEAHAERAHARPSPYSFVVASGAMRLLMTLMIHRGNALTATMTATFHPNRTDRTNDRSVTQERKRESKERKREVARAGKEVGSERTEVFGEEDHAKGVDAERDNFRDDHVNMPAGHQKSCIKKPAPLGKLRVRTRRTRS